MSNRTHTIIFSPIWGVKYNFCVQRILAIFDFSDRTFKHHTGEHTNETSIVSMALFFNDSFIHSITYLFLYIILSHIGINSTKRLQETVCKKQLLNHLTDEVELIFFENTASAEMVAYNIIIISTF